jgi:copper homeostasis protein
VELCAELDQDGLTPSHDLLAPARAACGLPLIAMVRPRAGDFVLRPGELEAMERSAAELLGLGADALVLGCLEPGGAIDARALERLVAAAAGAPVTFHRAFDRTPDPEAALERLVELGVARVLTSGQAPTAPEGATRLARLVERAGRRIEVVPGGGVRAHNAAELVRRTGARVVHSSLGPGRPPTPEAVAELVAVLAAAPGTDLLR